ncbi:M28 family peptidase [Maribacter chungangensis]|uniref:M28 family peptidase n=1 Tax=Maribacter chungangensis TaxID=1069117 RepID=A0ABW3B8F4_9FLAO
MKKTLSITILGLFLACNSSQKTVAPNVKQAASQEVYAETITEAELKEHLYVYASDEFEGRDTGAPGQKKAVAYLKAEYEKMVVPAAKPNGDYFQKVPLEVAQMPTGSLMINGTSFTLGEDFVSFNDAGANFNEIVYASYGIEEGGYSDFKNIDVTDKLVLIKDGEPTNSDGTYLLTGTQEPSKWSKDPMGRIQFIMDKGAKGVLLYSPTLFPRVLAYYNRSKNSSSGRMSVKGLGKTGFSASISDTMVKAILPDILTDNNPRILNSKVASDIIGNSEAIDSENVVAVIKGTEKPDEYVVISSHLDHIGVNADGQINNGADDDGSGTVAMLEIAEAFKAASDAGNGPKRSVVFLHVTGEEKGLLGSLYYTDVAPIFPLSQTVANLNIDMIGRIDPKREGERNYLYLIGSDKLSTELHELSEAVNAKYTNIEFDYTYNDENDPNRFYYRSDHYNFAKNNIPIIFYFNGTHDDYHKPGDTPDKINYDLLENRTRLIFHTAWEIANRDKAVMVDKPVE